MFPELHDKLIDAFGSYSFDVKDSKDGTVSINVTRFGRKYEIVLNEWSLMADVWGQIDFEDLRDLQKELDSLPQRKIAIKKQIAEIRNRIIVRMKS